MDLENVVLKFVKFSVKLYNKIRQQHSLGLGFEVSWHQGITSTMLTNST